MLRTKTFFSAVFGVAFGLSLYAQGSMDAIVGGVIGHMGEKTTTPDAHITEPLPAEDAPVEPKPDTRTTSSKPADNTIAGLRARTAAIEARAKVR